MQLRFDHPGMFLLLILLVPLVYIKYIWKQRGGRVLFSFNNWKGQGFRNSFSFQSLLYVLSHFMSWLALVLIIAGLAEPYSISKEKVYTSRGIDIMLVIDISPSMAAQDFAGRSRLESTQDTIRRFVARRKNDPIGLVAFGSQAALHVPPTLNYDYLNNSVESLRVLELGEGTALGMGLALASLHLRNSSAGERIMILFTDGESNAGEIQPQAAATLAAEAGIRLYVIDIGSDGEVLIEFVDPVTGKPYRALYKGEQREELLREISLITGGEYYPVRSPQTLENVLLSIDSFERVETRLKVNVRKSPLNRETIIIAFILIFLDYFFRKVLLREIL